MTDAPWEATEQFIRERTGLAFPDGRRELLEEGVARVMAACRIDRRDVLLRRLSDDPSLFDDVVSQIAVGETYFFRHPEQWSVIQDRVLAAFLAADPDRTVRVWCAGCATGEEPYTLALIAHERGISGRLRILGTDLSRRALKIARRGIYRPWSLRGTPPELRTRYFRQRGGGYELDRRVRDLVEFRPLNLVEKVYPSPRSGVWNMDLVLCRNVLIYFDAETAAAVAGRLIESLSDRGWLVLGASDPLLGQSTVPVTIVRTGAGLIYGPADREDAVPPVGDPAPAAPVPPEATLDCVRPAYEPVDDGPPAAATPRLPGAAAERLYRERAYAQAAALATQALRNGEPAASLWVLLVRALANLGRLQDAVRTCATAAEHHPTEAELAYLEAVLLLDLERPADAARSARRSLYLDRDFVMAHLALGGALSRIADREGARRAFVNAQSLLARLAPDTVVDGADGETAGRLLLLARTQAALLRREA